MNPLNDVSAIAVSGQQATAKLPTRAETLAHVRNILEQALKAGGESGRTVLYSELDELVNDDVRKSYRSLLNTARKNLLADYGMLFKTKTNIGFIPVSDAEKLENVGSASRKRIVAETGRWRSKHDSIGADSLTSQEKIKVYTRECMRLSHQEDINSGRNSLQIEAAIEEISAKKELERSELKRILHAANQTLRRLG